MRMSGLPVAVAARPALTVGLRVRGDADCFRLAKLFGSAGGIRDDTSGFALAKLRSLRLPSDAVAHGTPPDVASFSRLARGYGVE
jgi:hypothetical protein